MKKIIIVGGGPAGLFCAYQLLTADVEILIYDHSSAVGKKFLVAGKSGLNLTKDEPIDLFAANYGKDKDRFQQFLTQFSPTDLRSWCQQLGVDTFVGSSGKVFPTTLKAADILKKWTTALQRSNKCTFFMHHKLFNFTDHTVEFENSTGRKSETFDFLVLGLGGASWSQTGSDGKWVSIFKKLGIQVSPLLPMNCGFETQWSSYLQERVQYQALKNIELTFDAWKVKGEMVITHYGVEGGAIYALSNHIRNTIMAKQQAKIFIDLKPQMSEKQLLLALKGARKRDSLSNKLRKTLKFDGAMLPLLYELSNRECLHDLEYVAKQIKHLPLFVNAYRPIEEAISSSGGVCFSELSESLEIKKISNTYIIGEMLDFEAPTGGYLMQGCFSTAFVAAQHIKGQLLGCLSFDDE